MAEGVFKCYVPKKFTKAHMAVIEAANVVIEEYEAQGYSLTLRQIYYQFVSRDWIRNSQSEYTRLGGIISDARLAGLISWTSIEDRGRGLRGYQTFDRPGQVVTQARASYKMDLWADQQWRPEVWVEKQALEGVIGQICNKHRVDFFATKGYNSQSEQWRAGERLANYVRKGQRPIIFHLGDHDPSGIDMTRDNQERLSMFAGVPIIVQRLALNMSQIDQYNPPPNPAKMTDSRFEDYQRTYDTDESWELDALNPPVIAALIHDALERIKDPVLWEERVALETEHKRVLDNILEEMGEEPYEEYEDADE